MGNTTTFLICIAVICLPKQERYY